MKAPNWTKKEIEFIKQHKLDMTFDEMSIHLNRTARAISQKCKMLRFVRPKYDLQLEMTPSLAYILGCLCGDASILDTEVRLPTIDKEFADEFYNHCVKIMSSHYIPVSRFSSDNMHYVLVGSLAFKNFLIRNYGYLRAYDWRVPEQIFCSGDKDITRHYLKGFFDSEGSFNNYAIRVQVICLSLYEIGELLDRLDIKNKVTITNRKTVAGNTVYSLSITHLKNINLFKRQIGFRIHRKQESLIQYLITTNNSKSKNRTLWTSRKEMAELYTQGLSLLDIAKKFNIDTASTVSKYIKLVLKDDYPKYADYNKLHAGSIRRGKYSANSMVA